MWNPRVDCSKVWKLVETTYEVFQKFPMQGTMWNPKVDSSQVWKLVETTFEVSPKFPKQGIYVESSGWLLPGVETRENPARFP